MIELQPEFKFVVVWERAAVEDQVERFLTFGREKLHSRLQYLEDIAVIGLDRFDVLFAVHQADIWPFFYSRVGYRMHWLEDILKRYPERYPERLNAYRRY